MSQPPSLESVVADFLQKGYVTPKRREKRVAHALTLPLNEQLVLLIESDDPTNISFVCELLERDDFPAPLSTSLRALLLGRLTAVRVAFECGHLELFDGLRYLRIESYSKPVLPGGLGRLAQLNALVMVI